MKGEKGEVGPIGPAGKDGKSIIGPQGPRGEVGPIGPIGKNGIDGIDGVDGKSIIGPAGKDGKDADPNVVADIVVSQLATGTKLKPEHIQGLPKTLNELITFLRTGGFRGGGSSSGTATPVTTYIETPTGLINGVNITYTVTHSITTMFSLAINGQFLHPTADYSFSSGTITFVKPLPIELAGTSFTAVYQ